VQKIAELRSRIENVKVIFEGVTPTVETWYRSDNKQLFHKDTKCLGLSDAQIIDMTNYNPGKTSIISFPLQNEINKALVNKEKILLIMNRRGFSTMTSCNQCGSSVKCPRCNVNLTYMFSKKTMVCAHCSYKTELPNVCPKCNGSYMRSVGKGVEKIASEIVRLYPQANVASYDKDTLKVPTSSDIIIATQAIFKVIDQMNISIAAMMDFDAELNRFDFRSAQKAFSMLMGLKQSVKKKVFIQTSMPDDHCIRSVMKNDIIGFYENELATKKELGFPPYRNIVEIILRGEIENSVMQYSAEIFVAMKELAFDNVDILDPQPDIMPKLRDKYRYTILLKSKSVEAMLELIKTAQKKIKKRRVIVTVNVDP
jgi:primosomal protein N' (replication factor Y)